MILTLTLWLLWKAHPGVVVCAAFWISVVWILHSKKVTRYPAGAIILLGVVLNAAVTELNGGVMPVVGMPMHFQEASPIWQAAQTSNHLLILADHASICFFSIGDLVLIGGTAMFVLAKLHQKLSAPFPVMPACGLIPEPKPNCVRLTNTPVRAVESLFKSPQL
jgi:hypothetical protein